MASERRDALPVKVTYFFLSLVGFGISEIRKERRVLDLWLAYTFTAVVFADTIICCDLYFVWGDFNVMYWLYISSLFINIHIAFHQDVMYAVTNILTIIIIDIKFFTILIKRSHYAKLLRIARDSLWGNSETEYEKKVLKKCENQAMFFVIFFTSFALSTGILYIVEALWLNIQNNSTDVHERRFPFKIWFDVPIYETPNFQILFFAQAIMSFQGSILYFCFDNFLAVVNIFITGQFAILKNRLELVYNRSRIHSIVNDNRVRKKTDGELNVDVEITAREFKNCVRRHQFLIWIVSEVEGIYTFINLGSVLVYSLIICTTGYQLIMPGNVRIRRIKFAVYLGGCLSQLLSFAFTCHNTFLASVDVGEGPYNSKWYKNNDSEKFRALTRDFIIVIMRSQRPCGLTAAGFFPVTLDTLKSVLTTAFSYLTLIRQSSTVTAD